MPFKKLLMLVVIMFVCAQCVVFAAEEQFRVSQAGVQNKRYLPGDFVHIIVEAPLDTRGLTAQMPDGVEVELVHERATNVWHGLWQIPIGFKKGVYYAKLKAVDYENSFFEGKTTAFVIDEPSLITMVELVPTVETSVRKKQLAKQLAAEASILAREAQDKAQKVSEMVGEQEEASEEQGYLVEEVQKEPKKVAAKPIKKKTVKKKQVRFEPVANKEDLNLQKVRLVTVARFYIENLDYEKAKAQLTSLKKIDPNNKQVNTMLKRIDSVIKAKEGSE